MPLQKKILVSGVFFVVLGMGGVYVFLNQSIDQIPYAGQNKNRPTGGGIKSLDIVPDVIVRRTQEGYIPRIVAIKKGVTVTWFNDSGEFHWPVSDVHPTHRIYPAFDTKEPIGPGEGWSFTFKQTGEWHYHDHLRANLKGTIIVEDYK